LAFFADVTVGEGFSLVLGIETLALLMLGKHSTTDLYTLLAAPGFLYYMCGGFLFVCLFVLLF
jgi:hypothetical protein